MSEQALETKLSEQTLEASLPVFEAIDDQIRRTPYGYMQHMLRYRYFFLFWVKRSLITRYRRTSLGWLWAILQPLLNSLIFILLFSVLIPLNSYQVPYPMFIVTSLVFWVYFSRVVLAGASSVVSNVDLWARLQFPREFLPLAVWVESLVDLAIGFVIVLLAMGLFHVSLTIYTPLVLLVLAIESILALGVAFLLAALTVYIRDLLQAVPLALQLLMYLAPVIYPLVNVPHNLQALFLVNPLGPIFGSYDEVLLYGRFTLGPELALAGLISLVVFVLGYVVFKRVEWHFADIM